MHRHTSEVGKKSDHKTEQGKCKNQGPNFTDNKEYNESNTMYAWYLPQSKPNEVYAYQKLYQGKEPNEAQSQTIELMVVNEEPGLSDQSIKEWTFTMQSHTRFLEF